MSVVNCGHVPMLFMEHESGKIKQIESSSAPLGFFAEEKYSEVILHPKQGDIALLLTDGLTEHTNAGNEMFGLSGTINVFRKQKEKSPAELISSLFRECADFGNKPVFADDITLSVIRFGSHVQERKLDDGVEIVRPLAHH